MKNSRPINIYLLSYKYPITAIISILHRISGAFIFLLIPLLLWMLASSAASPQQFDDLQTTLSNPFIKLIMWLFLSALAYHFIAGIRHLLMDMGLGESLRAARLSAWAVIVLMGMFTLLIGIWLW